MSGDEIIRSIASKARISLYLYEHDKNYKKIIDLAAKQQEKRIADHILRQERSRLNEME